MKQKELKLFDVLVRESANRVFGALVLGLITGVGFSLLIPIVLMSFDTTTWQNLMVLPSNKATWLGIEVSNYRIAAAFFLTCLVIIALKTVSQVLMAQVSMKAAYSLRVGIYKRISHAQISSLESLGSSKLMAIITGDIPRIMTGATAIPDLIISIVTVVGILCFLAIVNFHAFLFVIASLAIGVITYQIPMSFGEKAYTEAREYLDKLHEGIRGIIYGAKELKLNERKRDDFYAEELLPNEDQIKNLERRGFLFMQTANNYGDMIGFLIVGIIAFVLTNYQMMSQADLFGVVMAMIYVISPIGAILQCLPLISVAKVSLARLNLLNERLAPEPSKPLQGKPVEWTSMFIRDLCFEYPNAVEGQKGFGVGPATLEIKRGQISFIVGGNGSGKSTLSKLLTLHYLPTSGEIAFGDEPVTDANRNLYRHEISAIYSDYYLFNKILGYSDEELVTLVEPYLDELQIKHKVEVTEGRFSTISLSDGQKRRLALIVSLLDNAGLYVFDEWAADQDPEFKKVFYQQVLPSLRAEGKAILVISHDDRYFNVADQVIWMESGQVSRIDYPNAAKPPLDPGGKSTPSGAPEPSDASVQQHATSTEQPALTQDADLTTTTV